MNIKTLYKIAEISEIKRDHISYEFELRKKELMILGEAIFKMLNDYNSQDYGDEIDSSSRWYEDYIHSLTGKIESDIHNYADRKCQLTNLRNTLYKEDQTIKVINKIIELEKISIKRENQNREEEDVEELCVAKQYSEY